jgi:non-ribosomal peptide synthetase component E (peptide arylation enzyme)
LRPAGRVSRTGAPKLIPRTHDDYVYNVTASADLCGLTGDDVYLVALPAAHNIPLACPGLLGAMSVGATTVFTTDPSPESEFAIITRHGVTLAHPLFSAGRRSPSPRSTPISTRVAVQARPDVLAPLSSLPTTAVGKVDKKALAKQLGS